MRYCLRCRVCGEVTWIRGHEESDTGALVLEEQDACWGSSCEHLRGIGDDYDVVDSEVEDDGDDFPESLA